MKFLFALLIVTFCISCKKDNVNFPQDLYLSKITSSTNVRMFINKIEIFDKSTIDNFITNTNIFNLQNQTIDPTVKMSFSSKDTALFGSPVSKYSVNLNGNQYLFTSSTSNLFTFLLVPSDIELYPYKSVAVPVVGGYNYYLTDIRVGYGNFTNLNMSLFSYKLIKRNLTSGNYQFSSATLYNEFNQNFINTLGQTDTLAIQEFKQVFVAK